MRKQAEKKQAREKNSTRQLIASTRNAKPENRWDGLDNALIGSLMIPDTNSPPFNSAITSKARYAGMKLFFAEAWIACTSNLASVSIGVGFSRSL